MIDFSFKITWLLLFILWLWFLPTSIQGVAETISSLAVYHTVNLNWSVTERLTIKRKGIEGFWEKCKKVLTVNFILTIPFLITYYIIISDVAKEEKNLDFGKVFCLSYLLALVSLVTVRILANQSKFLISDKAKALSNEYRTDYVAKGNEKTIAHFHTLVCTSLMVLGIMISASIITNQRLPLIYTPNGTEIGNYAYNFGIYMVALAISTIIVELLLIKFPPLIQIKQRDRSDEIKTEITMVDHTVTETNL